MKCSVKVKVEDKSSKQTALFVRKSQFPEVENTHSDSALVPTPTAELL